LYGEEGADTMRGELGNDFYYVDAGDAVIEAPGEGTDTVYAGFDYTLGPDVENLSTTNTGGTDALRLTGNALDNFIVGNAGANVIDGGAGADIMIGYIGDDIYTVDNLLDVVAEEQPTDGIDTVYANVSGYTLAVYVETLSLNAGTALTSTGNA